MPIHDKAHVRNALARFSQVSFEDDDARERARKRLLNAAKRYRIVPVGFITRQLRSERRHATAGRLVIELGRNAGIVLNRDALLERVWDYRWSGDTRLVDVHVQRLRAKIGAERIETVRGVGYKLPKS